MSGRSPRWFTGIQYPYEANFADNTWEQIIAACQEKIIPTTWKVGDQKAMTIGGTDYLIDIIGINHDTYAAGGMAPLTFQLHDCYADKKRMNSSNTNSGGWTSCAMRQTHLPAILALMPTEVQNGIREVNKLTSAGSNSATACTTYISVCHVLSLHRITNGGRVGCSHSESNAIATATNPAGTYHAYFRQLTTKTAH